VRTPGDNLALRETAPGFGGDQITGEPRSRQGAPASGDTPAGTAEPARRADDPRLALRTEPQQRERPRVTQPGIVDESVPQDERTPSAPPDAGDAPSSQPGSPQRSGLPATRFEQSPQISALPQVTSPEIPAERTIEEPRSNAFGPMFAGVTPRIDYPQLKQGEQLIAPTQPFNLLDPQAMRSTPAAIEPSQANDELRLTSRPQVPSDPELKSSALNPPDSAREEGLSIVSKGEVTGPGKRPRTPADILGLTDETRPAAVRCMANAVYFEARGEPVSGQIAVAQVVLNRALSGFYPRDVCGVVYQNSHRHLACQFTFSCDGIPDVVTEPDMFSRAERIAVDMLDGRLWIEDVGKATHYHANWVLPWWRRLMNNLISIGVHIFYRPFAWGDGSDAPGWGQGRHSQDVPRDPQAPN
jgi:spore germination cell wall hydrolase CwlJ-like protein